MKKRAICLVLAVLLIIGSVLPSLASTVNEVQQKQSETQQQLNEVNKSIKAIENKKNKVREELSHLNEDLVETMLGLELLEADVEAKQEEIDEAQAEYERLKKLEEQQYAAMKLRIQYMYERDSMDFVGMLLEAKSLSELINRADFAQEVSDYDDEKLSEYEETKLQIEEVKQRLEEEQAVLLEIQHDQMVYKEELDNQISSAKSKVKNFETELANAQAKAAEYKNTIKEQNALITKLKEEERRAAEEAARKKAEEESKEEVSESGSNGSSNSNSSSGSNSSGSSSSKEEAASPSGGSGTLGEQIAQYALQFVGNPYVYGGTSLTNGADCSGFTQAVHKKFGIYIPRRSQDQAKGGKGVSLDALLPGDIIYYENHVALYIGNGRVVHASTAATGIKTDRYNYRTPTCARRYW